MGSGYVFVCVFPSHFRSSSHQPFDWPSAVQRRPLLLQRLQHQVISLCKLALFTLIFRRVLHFLHALPHSQTSCTCSLVLFQRFCSIHYQLCKPINKQISKQVLLLPDVARMLKTQYVYPDLWHSLLRLILVIDRSKFPQFKTNTKLPTVIWLT